MRVPKICLSKWDHFALSGEHFSKVIFSSLCLLERRFLYAVPYSSVNTVPMITSPIFLLYQDGQEIGWNELNSSPEQDSTTH